MAVVVDPPPLLKIPRELTKTPEMRAFFEQERNIITQIWRRTGSGEDFIDSTEQILTATNSRVARNAAKINALERVDFEVETVTENFTTKRNQILICRNTIGIEVTLDTSSIEGDQVHIKRRDAYIDVIGMVDGVTNVRINLLKYSLFLVYDGIDWSQI